MNRKSRWRRTDQRNFRVHWSL